MLLAPGTVGVTQRAECHSAHGASPRARRVSGRMSAFVRFETPSSTSLTQPVGLGVVDYLAAGAGCFTTSVQQSLVQTGQIRLWVAQRSANTTLGHTSRA